jgi:hypothetical protein
MLLKPKAAREPYRAPSFSIVDTNVANLLALHDPSSGEEGKRDVVELVNTSKTGSVLT